MAEGEKAMSGQGEITLDRVLFQTRERTLVKWSGLQVRGFSMIPECRESGSNLDREACGLILPATCEPEGYTHQIAAGNVRMIPPQDSVSFHITTGALNPGQTENMARTIESLIESGD